MKTRITELLGTTYPILQGPLPDGGEIEPATLAAAVSNAGGLGMLPALAYPTPEALADAIAQCRALTQRPFGVHLRIGRRDEPAPYEAYLDVAIAGGVALLETAGECPRALIEKCKRHGVRVLHWCANLRDGLVAERKGVDAVGIDRFGDEPDGAEASPDGLVVIPLGAQTLRIPLVAAGGSALAAALAQGAEGVSVAFHGSDIAACAQRIEGMARECGRMPAPAAYGDRGAPPRN